MSAVQPSLRITIILSFLIGNLNILTSSNSVNATLTTTIFLCHSGIILPTMCTIRDTSIEIYTRILIIINVYIEQTLDSLE